MNHFQKRETTTSTINQTIHYGKALGKSIESGAVLSLNGPLGVGKTTLVKGIAAGLEVPKDALVSSPSFVLIRQYAGKYPVFHIDLYRLDSMQAADREQILECMNEDSVVIVEWGNKAADLFPPNHLLVDMNYVDSDEKSRKISLTFKGGFELKA